jgi:hypothetical protein
MNLRASTIAAGLIVTEVYLGAVLLLPSASGGAPVREEGGQPAVTATTEVVVNPSAGDLVVPDEPVFVAPEAPVTAAVEDDGLIPSANLYVEPEGPEAVVELCLPGGHSVLTGEREVQSNDLHQYVAVLGDECYPFEVQDADDAVLLCLPGGFTMTTGRAEVVTNNLQQYVCPDKEA